MEKRIERDTVGQMEMPPEVYYGVQSLRAQHNFPISGRPMHPLLIESLAEIKKAAALANAGAGELEQEKADAIVKACDEIIAGQWRDQFICDAIQGGAGTSANMNANEVIANRAGELLGGVKGKYDKVHPNDHVNMAQSTNDVFPTAGKMTVLKLLSKTVKQLEALHAALLEKAKEYDGIIKVGRTQMQDAVPIRLGQEFAAWAAPLGRDIRRLTAVRGEIEHCNMGATAIGTAINASAYYLDHIAEHLSQVSGLPMKQTQDLVDGTQNLDGFVVVSGALKAAAVSMSKMSNDLRLLSSGPKAGIGEIKLPAMQNGSSIMPGKVNPVIPEVVSQVAFNIIGNDVCITLCAEAGQMELNAFEPVLFYNLFESIEQLGRAAETLTENCVKGIEPNLPAIQRHMDESLVRVTAMVPHIGYTKTADMAHQSLESGKPIRKILEEQTDFSKEELDKILDADHLTRPANQR